MFLVNWTKFSHTYWKPWFDSNKDVKKGFWYLDLRWLRIQLCLYSQPMAMAILESAKRGMTKENIYEYNNSKN